MMRWTRMTALTLTAALGALVLAPVPALAGSKGKRNTALLLGAAAVYGVVKKKPVVAGVAGAGALYTYMQSRKDREKELEREKRQRQRRRQARYHRASRPVYVSRPAYSRRPVYSSRPVYVSRAGYSRGHVPPGLAKKGGMPPGQAKKCR